MSELNAAMQAALASVDTERRPRTDVPAKRAQAQPRPQSQQLWSSTVVARDDEQSLPPIVGRRAPTTFTDALREQYGAVAASIWTTIREAALLVVLFWVSAIMLAFVEVEGAVTIPGVGDATVITVALVAAVVLRAVLAAAKRSGQALESHSR